MFQKRMNKRKKAQSTLEYAVFIFAMVAALLSMQVYIKRAIQGGFRTSADNLGEQYAPKHTNSEIYLESHSQTTTTTKTEPDPENAENEDNTITTTKVITDYDTTSRHGDENLGQLESGLFE